MRLSSFRARGVRWAGLGAAWLVLGASLACKDTQTKSGCIIGLQTILPGTSLTLDDGARLVRAGDGFFLTSVSGNTMRFAPIGADGKMGDEATFTTPATRTMGPWLAVAAATDPADRAIVVWVEPKSGATSISEIHTQALGRDGTPAGSALAIQEIPSTDVTKMQVAVTSASTGRRALVAWGVRGEAKVQYVVLGGEGAALGNPFNLGDVKSFDCLRGAEVRTEVGLGFLDYSNGPEPEWRLVELRENGELSLNVGLPLEDAAAECPIGAPRARGYSLAWQTPNGSYLGLYDDDRTLFNKYTIAGAVRWGGAGDQPPLGGLVATASDLAVVFSTKKGPEVWRLDREAARKGDILFPPVSEGMPGLFVGVPVMGALYGTYADYAPAGGAETPSDAGGEPDAADADAGAADGGASDAGVPDAGGSGGAAKAGSRRFVRIDCI